MKTRAAENKNQEKNKNKEYVNHQSRKNFNQGKHTRFEDYFLNQIAMLSDNTRAGYNNPWNKEPRNHTGHKPKCEANIFIDSFRLEA